MIFTTQGTRIEINVATRAVLFQHLRQYFTEGKGFALATLNLDHLTKLAGDTAFLTAYTSHDLIVADGRPIVWLSRLARRPVELMPGSDLIHPICEIAAKADINIALLGSTKDALTRASAALIATHPNLKITLNIAPDFGFDPEGQAAQAYCATLNQDQIGLCFLALGAPKQERFAAFARKHSPNVGFASIGAGLDFLAGHQTRAPRWMRVLPLEWLWRILQSPARMLPRYAKCFAILPRLTLAALRLRNSK